MGIQKLLFSQVVFEADGWLGVVKARTLCTC